MIIIIVIKPNLGSTWDKIQVTGQDGQPKLIQIKKKKKSKQPWFDKKKIKTKVIGFFTSVLSQVDPSFLSDQLFFYFFKLGPV